MNERGSSPISDLLFDPWATAQGTSLRAISERVLMEIHVSTPPTQRLRKRRPRVGAVERRAETVSTIIANLFKLHLEHPKSDRVAMPLKNIATTRYDRKDLTTALSEMVHAMHHTGHIELHPAIPNRRRTGIEATGWLLKALKDPALCRNEIGRAEGEETIWLSARMGRDPYGKKHPYEQVDYEDTAETQRLRAELEEVNAFLRSQRIELDGEPQAAFRLTRRFLLRSPDHPHTFNLHGRLYGGFWLSMPAHRRNGLRINGEPIADLDFASMFPRLAYLDAGATCPEGDLYAIPGLEEHRAAVKAGLSALFSTQADMSRLPSEVKAGLPPGWTAAKFRDAVAMKHPALVPLFGRDFALDLMFTESNILVAALLDLAREGVPALPMHDGMMVAASREEKARGAMEKACVELVGSIIPVTKKQ